jgi:hypothetical protein
MQPEAQELWEGPHDLDLGVRKPLFNDRRLTSYQIRTRSSGFRYIRSPGFTP